MTGRVAREEALLRANTPKQETESIEGEMAERLLNEIRDPEKLEFLWREVRRRTRTKVTRDEVRASVEAALEGAWERAALRESDQ